MAKQATKSKELYEAEELDSPLEKEMKKLERRNFTTLIAQVQSEFDLSYFFMKPKHDEWALRLKLYSNQKRNKEAVGDPLMFTIHQTILASLYSDRLVAGFQGRNQGDDDVAENLGMLAEYDAADMMKDKFDYDFDWDASFFGRGLGLFMEFDRELMLPLPENIDPMTWLRDPRAKSVAGDVRGRGGMRFGGREIRVSKFDLKRDKELYFNLKGLKTDGTDINSVFDRNTLLRADAQGLGDVSKYDVKGANSEYRFLEWFTRWRGDYVLVTLADNRKRIVRFRKLGKVGFPIIDRSIFPMAHDWDGVSIPDLTEDKQRARSVVQNLGLRLIKRELHPRVLFNTNKITNRADLDREEDKHIPVDGPPDGAIMAVPGAAVKQEVSWILDVLDTAAQRATATPEIQQGAQADDKRTLGEIQLISSKVDTRYSLAARIFGWSEKAFWKQYLRLYDENFKDGIDEKTIRIAGAMGSTWKTLSRPDIIGTSYPDIIIESEIIASAKRLENLGMFRQFIKDARETLPQDTNMRYALRRMGKLSGFKRDEINSVLPPNIDELDADEENAELNENKRVEVEAGEDHVLHMEIHAKAADTKAKEAHLKAHRKAMMVKRENPGLIPEPNPVNPEELDGADGLKVAAGAATGRKLPLPQ